MVPIDTSAESFSKHLNSVAVRGVVAAISKVFVLFSNVRLLKMQPPWFICAPDEPLFAINPAPEPFAAKLPSAVLVEMPKPPFESIPLFIISLFNSLDIVIPALTFATAKSILHVFNEEVI